MSSPRVRVASQPDRPTIWAQRKVEWGVMNALVKLGKHKLAAQRAVIDLMLLTPSSVRHSPPGFFEPALSRRRGWILIGIGRVRQAKNVQAKPRGALRN